MKQVVRYKPIFLIFIIALINCAFVPVRTKIHYTNNNAGVNLSDPAEGRTRVRKLPFISRIIHKLGEKIKNKKKKGSIGSVVIIAILLFLLLVVITFALAYGGASALAGIVFFGGLAAIIFASVRTIRAIKRKRRTAL